MEQNNITGIWETALTVLGASMSTLAGALWWVLRDRAAVSLQIDRLESGLSHLRETYADNLDNSQTQVTEHRSLHDAVIRLEAEVKSIKERLDRGRHHSE
jgi:hypothetical protein